MFIVMTDQFYMHEPWIGIRPGTPCEMISVRYLDDIILVDKSMDKGIVVISAHPVDFSMDCRAAVGRFMKDDTFRFADTIPIVILRQAGNMVVGDAWGLEVVLFDVVIDVRDGLGECHWLSRCCRSKERF